MKYLLLAIGSLFIMSCGTSGPEHDLSGEATFNILDTVVAVDQSNPASTASFVTLETRSNIQVQMAILEPDVGLPTANLILFAGGGGVIDMAVTESLSGNEFYIYSGNFLVRTRSFFSANNVRIFIVNAPSDKQSGGGMKGGFRFTDKHRYDIDSVIKYITDPSGMGSVLPVWLVGTSRGTESAAYLALNLNYSVDGIVLTSPITVTNWAGSSVVSLPLNNITAPVFISVHDNDGCYVTPPSGGALIRDALTASSSVLLMNYTGGSEPGTDPCKGLTYHGYYGIESTVITDIINFINAN